MKRFALLVLLSMLSTAALAQNTYCSTYGNSMNCQTYGGAGNQQSSSTNCWTYGNSINCQQYQHPQINPDGCGSPVTCALQGYMKGQQEAQQRQIQQQRLVQMRLQNELLQQQLQLQQQRQEAQLQRQQAERQQQPVYQQRRPLSAADQQTVDDEERQLQQDIANGHP